MDSGGNLSAILHVRGSGEAAVMISETNEFRELTHLVLVMRKGNDEAVKKYLAAQLLNANNCCGDLENRLTCLEHRIQDVEGENNELKKKCVDIEKERISNEANLCTKFSNQASTTKESHMRQLNDLRQRLDDEHASEVTSLREQIQRLESSNKSLDSKLSGTSYQKDSLQRSQENLTSKVETLQNELSDEKQHCANLKMEIRELDARCHQQDCELTELRIRLENAEDQGQKQQQMIANSQTAVEEAKQNRNDMEESLNVYKANLSRVEEKFQVSVQEINKGNEIITKLQVQMRSLKNKLKDKGSTNSDLDKCVNDLKRHNDKLGGEVELVISKLKSCRFKKKVRLSSLKSLTKP
eukprot:GHVL01013496.1.p1 GENE.GHVL01013496.1~~GHVL01013496.1.p1  ORF type:complete len:355 (+),score=64.29 GHVL01013496.1:524-1588(+)